MTTKKNSKSVSRMFLFENNEQGRAGLTALRNALNRGAYSMRTWGRGSRKYATNYAKDIPVDVGSHIAVYIYPKRQTDADYACRPRINDWEHATYEERLNLSQNNGVDINMVDVDVTDVAQEQLERED